MKCHNCGQIGHKARDCPKEVICRICHKSGHISTNCPKSSEVENNDIKCYNCGKYGHKSYDCIYSSNNNYYHKEDRCYNCGKTGHKSFECKNLPQGKNCYKCGKPGHISAYCTLNENEKTQAEIKCPSCNELQTENKKLLLGACGHALCTICWKNNLKSNEETCPICKSCFNQNQLKDISINLSK